MGEQESKVLEGQEGVQDEAYNEDAIEAVEMAETTPEPVDADPGDLDVGSARVDLNTATEEELQQLPGIGATLAARIVDFRDEVGPFAHPAEVTAVAGVSEATYARLADLISASSVDVPGDPEPGPALPEMEMLQEEPELEAEFQVEGPEDLIAPEPEAEDM
ncbi:MAG: hypothetical protein GWN58_63610, partial [Anaerolineae bacterium]|nr:hypothetical protein [Anaerolineae bacterium]